MKDTRKALSKIDQDQIEERGTNMRTANRANDAGQGTNLRTRFISIAATGALALALFIGATVVPGPAAFAEVAEELVPQTPEQDVAICDNAGGDPEMEFNDAGEAVGVDCTFPDGSGWACSDDGDGLGYGCVSWGEDVARDLVDAPELPVPPFGLAPDDPSEPPDLGIGDAPESGDVYEPTDTPKVCGDVNDDGVVNAIDAALVVQFNAGLIDVLVNERSADVNGDGDITSVDAALILQFTAGLIDELDGCL